MSHDEHSDDEDVSTQETDYAIRMWSLGDHRHPDAKSADDLRDEIERLRDSDDPGLAAALEEAEAELESADVVDFECPTCGFGHGHSADKHDVRSAFEVGTQFADDEMDKCPYCHCGVAELAMLVDFYEYLTRDNRQMFADGDSLSEADLEERFETIRSAAESAPVHDETRRTIEARRDELAQARDRWQQDESEDGSDDADGGVPTAWRDEDDDITPKGLDDDGDDLPSWAIDADEDE